MKIVKQILIFICLTFGLGQVAQAASAPVAFESASKNWPAWEAKMEEMKILQNGRLLTDGLVGIMATTAVEFCIAPLKGDPACFLPISKSSSQETVVEVHQKYSSHIRSLITVEYIALNDFKAIVGSGQLRFPAFALTPPNVSQSAVVAPTVVASAPQSDADKVNNDAARVDATIAKLAAKKEAGEISQAEFDAWVKKITDVQKRLALKADKKYVDAKLALKADKLDVENKLANKVETSVFTTFLNKFGFGDGQTPVFATTASVGALATRVGALEQTKQLKAPFAYWPWLTWQWIAIGFAILLATVATLRTFGRRR